MTEQYERQVGNHEPWFAALGDERLEAVRVRVNDLWPEGLEAVPGTYEVALKRDADTIRAALNQAAAMRGITWRENPEIPGQWALDVHRDGWDVEILLGPEIDFSVGPRRPANSQSPSGS